ncbi:hypothetical protein F5Y16DRAFT_377940 [Xylariaceae sp. FL0255]|nr:hypothetical protein F5Y16DRAFT_377940 [Xylariaceae sp. FL0255]
MTSHNRRTTRASGCADLTGSIDDVIRAAKTNAIKEKRAFREQRYQSDQIPKFHSFMKLPLELRARIYFFTMEDADPPHRHLPTLRAPTLALVSKQIQHEAMHIFLSRCTFFLNITSNFGDISKLDEKAFNGTILPLKPRRPRHCCTEASALSSGRCEPLSKRTRTWLLKVQGDSDELFFPHVAMHIRPSGCCWSHRHNRDKPPTAVLSMHSDNGQLQLDYKNGNDEVNVPSGLDRLRKAAEAVARNITGQHKSHLGFCYDELEEIARELRYWPPGAPEE